MNSSQSHMFEESWKVWKFDRANRYSNDNPGSQWKDFKILIEF